MKDNIWKRPSLKCNIIYSTLYQILLLITPLITAPYISRVLGPEGNGIYSYANSYQILFSMFASLGTLSYGQREIARNRDKIYIKSQLFWEIELMSIITSLVCILGWGVFVFFQKEYRLIYFILTLNIFNTMFDISWFFAGMEQFKYTITKNMVCKVVGVILQLTFVKKKEDVVLYVLILCLTNLLGTMSMWLTLPKFLVKIPVDSLEIKKHFKETIVYFIPTIATTVYTALDKTLIGIITKDNAQNGYYEQANKIISMLKALTFVSLNSVIGSRISYLFAEKKYEEIKNRIKKSVEYILFIGIGMCFGLIAIADNFVPWFFGDGYDEVILLLQVFSPIIVIIGLSNCLGAQYYTPAGLRKKSAQYVIVGAVVNVIFNLILIPQYKASGAAIASVVAEFVITVLYLKNCDKYVEIKVIIEYGWKKIVAAFFMCLSICNKGQLFQNLTISVMCQVVVGSVIYVVILMVLKDRTVLVILEGLKKKLKRYKE